MKKLIKRILPPRVLAALKCLIFGVPNLLKENPGNQSWIFGMTSPDDQNFFRSAASSVKNDIGEIVDLGCWMGSTSVSLAQGCVDSAIFNRVRAYDLFRWENWMDKNLPYTFCDYRPGETFLPEVRKRLQNFAETIELIQSDLCFYKYDNKPIKLLLVDAMKTKELAKAICSEFYPSLLPNSLVIHQDFKHYFTPWIHILQFRLRDYFETFHVVQNGDTAAFKLKKKIPLELAASESIHAEPNDAEVDDIFLYSFQVVNLLNTSGIAAAHVMHYLHNNNIDAAQVIFHRYSSKSIFKDREISYLKNFCTDLFE
jgi:hypothetical protein